MKPALTTSLSPETPTLILATQRFRRILWGWAATFLAMAALDFALLGTRFPVPALVWLAGALLLALGRQPAFLALVAVQWGLSLTALHSGFQAAFGPDPLGMVFRGEAVENVVLGAVRVLLMVMAWSQFLFYRMLYGTAGASGLDKDLPSIPEMIPNRTDQMAAFSRLAGFLAICAALVALILPLQGVVRLLAAPALGLATYAIGLGIGAAFSPIHRRVVALIGIGLGVVGFLLALAAGRVMSF
ncbi:MAG TPA: hypothetical protein VJ123_10230 [Anaerolineales bacterium]|nr:hypothetical protein [Anaerolineales bacterium]